MSVNSGQKNNQYQHIYIFDILPCPPVTDIKFVYEQLHNHSNWLEVQLCAVCCASFLFCQVQPYPPPSRPLVHPCPSPLHGHTHTYGGVSALSYNTSVHCGPCWISGMCQTIWALGEVKRTGHNPPWPYLPRWRWTNFGKRADKGGQILAMDLILSNVGRNEQQKVFKLWP